MFLDVCIPKNNEEKYINVAERIGTKGLLFLYDKKEKDISSLQEKTKLKLFTGLLINKNPSKNGIYFAKGERKNIENKNIPFLYGFETIEQKDSYHFRRGGINQVLAKLMKTKNKVLVIDMEKLLTAKEPEMLLGRLKQNLLMIKKYKLDSVICSFATEPLNLRAGKDYEAFIRMFGYQEEAKKSISSLNEFLKN